MSALRAGFLAPIRRSPDALFRIRFPGRKNVACAARKNPCEKFLRTTVTIQGRIPGARTDLSARAGDRRPLDSFVRQSLLDSFVGRSTPKEFFKTTAAVNFTSLSLAKDM